MQVIEAGFSANGKKFALVVARFNSFIVESLLSGATDTLQRIGNVAEQDITVIRVPGAFELPLAAQRAANSGADAVIALGVVIQGDTPHFDYVCNSATDGLTRVQLDSGIPIGFGLLTVNNEKEALDRAGLEGSKEDKGAEAVQAALYMSNL